MIRTAAEPDSPSLLTDWFELDQCDEQQSIQTQREHFESQFRLLLDTVSDELLPSQWRCTCLNNIYRPLKALNKLANSEQSTAELNKLFYELNVICNYVKASLLTPIELFQQN